MGAGGSGGVGGEGAGWGEVGSVPRVMSGRWWWLDCVCAGVEMILKG